MPTPSVAQITCPYCKGTKEVGPAHDRYVCIWCSGTGLIPANTKIDLEAVRWLRINGAKTESNDATAVKLPPTNRGARRRARR